MAAEHHPDPTDDPKTILDRVARETETLGTSALARASAHLSGRDAPPDSPAELWGRRIGRALSVLFAIYLVISLVTMLRP
jgi:hypothetical protein